MLTLYHGRTSVCSVKVRLVLAEKGVDFDSRLLTLRGDQFDPAYIKLNPGAVVPTLVHDGEVIVESTVISHYIDEAFPGRSLMPADARGRAAVRLMGKLMDEYVHTACMTVTFATANRATLARLTPAERDAELARTPDRKRAEIKREVVAHGLDAPVVAEALRVQQKLLDRIEVALKASPYLAGPEWSLADAYATPYVWRFEKLKLAQMWENRPGVAAWYARVRERPSFKVAVEDWLTPAEHERYANEPDPWPKVAAILRAA